MLDLTRTFDNELVSRILEELSAVIRPYSPNKANVYVVERYYGPRQIVVETFEPRMKFTVDIDPFHVLYPEEFFARVTEQLAEQYSGQIVEVASNIELGYN